jgi:hypothetical protein
MTSQIYYSQSADLTTYGQETTKIYIVALLGNHAFFRRRLVKSCNFQLSRICTTSCAPLTIIKFGQSLIWSSVAVVSARAVDATCNTIMHESISPGRSSATASTNTAASLTNWTKWPATCRGGALTLRVGNRTTRSLAPVRSASSPRTNHRSCRQSGPGPPRHGATRLAQRFISTQCWECVGAVWLAGRQPSGCGDAEVSGSLGRKWANPTYHPALMRADLAGW